VQKSNTNDDDTLAV